MSSRDQRRQDPPGYWAQKRIIGEIGQRFHNGETLNASFASKNLGPLYYSTSKVFGSWENPIRAPGMNCDSIFLQKRWSMEIFV